MSLIWIVNILSVFFLCVFFAGIVIPQILLIAFRRRLFDEPDERKIHQCVVPRLGGMAFKPVVFFSFVLLLAVNVSTGHDELLKEIGAEALPLAYAFCAIIMLYLVGIADDLIGVRYRAKFFIQIVCGIMLVAGGVELSDLHGMLFIHSMPSWISIPLTVFVTVFIINAINLIDGIDGLASGLCSIAFLFYGMTFIWFHQYLYAMLAFATLGVLIPFYYYKEIYIETERIIIRNFKQKDAEGLLEYLSHPRVNCFAGDRLCSREAAWAYMQYSPKDMLRYAVSLKKDDCLVDKHNKEFVAIGYECMGEFGIEGRRYFRKGGDNRTHQIHIFEQSNHKDINRHIAVRDFLRTHPDIALEYGELKMELAYRFSEDIEGYCTGKDAFVKQLEKDALLWYQNNESYKTR